MSKRPNKHGNMGREKAGDRSKHWKYGKSSGRNDPRVKGK